MRRSFFVLLFFFFVTGFAGAVVMAAKSEQEGITRADIAAPDKFCTVLKEPDPALLGAWKCVHDNYVSKLATYRPEPVQFYLAKFGNGYALYFYRSKKATDGEVYRGWKEWKIDGDQIVSNTGVRIFTKDGAVYYSWQNDKPTQMSRIEGIGPP
jgi:hypothetical protein